MRLKLGLRYLADKALRGVLAMGVERRQRHIVELAAAHHDSIAAVYALHGADAVAVHVGDIGAGAHLLLRREGVFRRVDRDVDGVVGLIDALVDRRGQLGVGGADIVGGVVPVGGVQE